MNRKIKTSRILYYAISIIIVFTSLYGCDTLESDVAPRIPEVEVEGTEIFVAKNGTGIIDLNSMIRSSGAVRLDITGRPLKGELTKLSNTVLQYVPSENFKNGKDAFEFSIYARDNSLIGKDTVIIIVQPDSTKLPCGIYPQNDYVRGVTQSVTIPVLANDILCGDSANFALEIYRPNNSYPPYYGSATTVAGKIRYTPGPNFNGRDSIIYKVYNVNDTTKYGIGRVYISPAAACTFQAFNDNFVLKRDSLKSDTLFLDIFQNDKLCGRQIANYQLTLVKDGDVGQATKMSNGLQFKIPPSPQTFTDSALYKLCYGGRCETATVYIEVKK